MFFQRWNTLDLVTKLNGLYLIRGTETVCGGAWLIRPAHAAFIRPTDSQAFMKTHLTLFWLYYVVDVLTVQHSLAASQQIHECFIVLCHAAFHQNLLGFVLFCFVCFLVLPLKQTGNRKRKLQWHSLTVRTLVNCEWKSLILTILGLWEETGNPLTLGEHATLMKKKPSVAIIHWQLGLAAAPPATLILDGWNIMFSMFPLNIYWFLFQPRVCIYVFLHICIYVCIAPTFPTCILKHWTIWIICCSTSW